MNRLDPWMSPQLPRCFSCTAEMARDLFVAERAFGDRRASDAGAWPRSAKGRTLPSDHRERNDRSRVERKLMLAHSANCLCARRQPQNRCDADHSKASIGCILDYQGTALPEIAALA